MWYIKINPRKSIKFQQIIARYGECLMLAEERFGIILELLEKQQTVSISDVYKRQVRHQGGRGHEGRPAHQPYCLRQANGHQARDRNPAGCGILRGRGGHVRGGLRMQHLARCRPGQGRADCKDVYKRQVLYCIICILKHLISVVRET